MCYVTDMNMRRVPYSAIREAMRGEPYPMELVGEAAGAVEQAVNQGIDSHLEACYAPSRGDSFEWGDRRTSSGLVITTVLRCQVSTESLPVLIRRLLEADDESSQTLGQDILDSLDSED